MKRKILLAFATLALNTVSFAQNGSVGIGTTTPQASALLELQSSDKALLVTRVPNVMSVQTPTNGMLVYDVSLNCFRFYQNGAWSPCVGVTPPAAVVNGLNCTGFTPSPANAFANTQYNGIGTLPYSLGNGAAYTSQTIASTGVTGLIATLASGTLNNNADGIVYFNISGTPASTGNASFAFTFGGQSCSFTLPVSVPAAVATTNCVSSTTTGTLTAGTAASGVTVTVPYTSGNGGAYNAFSITATGVNGLTAAAPAGNVNSGNGNLVLNISGTPNTSGTATFNLNFASTSCQFTVPVAAGGPQVAALTCGSASFSPATLNSGTAYSGTITVPYTGGNGQAYAAGSGIASTGVTGLTATLQAGTLASGAGNLTYNVSGTPNTSGTAAFALSFGGQNCSVSKTVTASPATLPAGTGTFSGKTCFDIALGNDNANGCGSLSSRTSQQANFTQTATNTQTYTFTPSGTVSNVRFQYVNTNGNVITAISGNNTGNNITTAVNATVNYNTSLNTLAAGLTMSNQLTADIYVIYNDGATNNGTDRQVKLTTMVKDCSCCGAYVAGVWKNFMCHNLGADLTSNPFTDYTYRSNGAYIQWGKRGPSPTNNPLNIAGLTGNSSVDWQTYPNAPSIGFAAAPTASNPNSNAIVGWNNTPAPPNSWAATKTSEDPCPSGYRVPTQSELEGLMNNPDKTMIGNWTSSPTNYESRLRVGNQLVIPVAGFIRGDNAILEYRGYNMTLLGSTSGSTSNMTIWGKHPLGEGVGVWQSYAGYSAYSVRCIAE